VSAAPGSRRWTAPRRRGPAALSEQLLTASVLLLLHDGPATSEEVCDGLAPFGLHEHPDALQRRLESMEEVGLVFSTWGPAASAPERHTFHIAPEGMQWLRHAAGALETTEFFLGAFVARCAERCLTQTSQGRSPPGCS
jgi:DNA-binding PadR family transcriptional regulator